MSRECICSICVPEVIQKRQPHDFFDGFARNCYEEKTTANMRCLRDSPGRTTALGLLTKGLSSPQQANSSVAPRPWHRERTRAARSVAGGRPDCEACVPIRPRVRRIFAMPPAAKSDFLNKFKDRISVVGRDGTVTKVPNGDAPSVTDSNASCALSVDDSTEEMGAITRMHPALANALLGDVSSSMEVPIRHAAAAAQLAEATRGVGPDPR